MLLLGLRHVSDNEKTHKNPALRGQTAPQVRTGPKPFASSSSSPKPAAPAAKKPPVLELEGKKWKVVSNFLAEESNVHLWFLVKAKHFFPTASAGVSGGSEGPVDQRHGAQTSRLRLPLQQQHAAGQGQGQRHHHRWGRQCSSSQSKTARLTTRLLINLFFFSHQTPVKKWTWCLTTSWALWRSSTATVSRSRCVEQCVQLVVKLLML